MDYLYMDQQFSGDNHTYSGSSTPIIDSYNEYTHTTSEFQSGSGIYHYYFKTRNEGGNSSNVFWITNAKYHGNLGTVTVRKKINLNYIK